MWGLFHHNLSTHTNTKATENKQPRTVYQLFSLKFVVFLDLCMFNSRDTNEQASVMSVSLNVFVCV